MLEKLQEMLGPINDQLGTDVRVVEKRQSYYGFYQLQDAQGKPLISTWRNYATMAYHLGTVQAILDQVQNPRQIPG